MDDAGRRLDGAERMVLQALAEGLSITATAERLDLPVEMVREQLRQAMSELGAHSRLEAVIIAVRSGLVTLELER